MRLYQVAARRVAALFVLAALGLMAACAAPGPAPALNTRSSGLQVTLRYDQPNEVMSVRLADDGGAPVTDAVVSLEGNMNHAGMVPVVTEAVRDDADGAADGLYTLPFAFSMWGDWILTVTVEQADGSTVTYDIEAQVTGDGVTIAGMAAGQLVVTHVRARPAPLAGGTGAVYLTVVNGTDEEEWLLAASSPVAQAVELHETVNDNGVMRMHHQPEGFAIAPGETLELMPGGKHVMLIGLAAPLVVGDSLTLTLTFAQAGDQVVQAPVMEIEGTGEMQMPMTPSGDGHDDHADHDDPMTPTPMQEHGDHAGD